jgi:deferrochelatase/peroxidase EfeB
MVARAGLGRDDLTRYTRALTGAYYFVPSTEALASFSGGDEGSDLGA